MATNAGVGSVLNPVHRMAAQKGLLEIIRRYLEKGGDVNATDSKGCSLLYWARKGGNQDLCDLLMSAGAIETDGRVPDSSVTGTVSGVQLLNSEDERGREPAQSLLSEGAAPAQITDAEESLQDGWIAEEEVAEPESAYRVEERAPAHKWIEHSLLSDAVISPDDEGWVAEQEGQCPPGDEEYVARARAIQAKISLHSPADDAAGWDEVEINKSPQRKRRISEAVAKAIDEEAVAALIEKVEADACVSLAQIESIAPCIEGVVDDVFIDVATRVVAELGGLIEDDVPSELFDSDELLYSSLKRKRIDEMADVISFFEDRYRGEKDALKIYASQIRRYELLSPKEEIEAGKEIAESLCDAVRIICRSKFLLQTFIGGFSTSPIAGESSEYPERASGNDPEVGCEEDDRKSASAALIGEIFAALEEAGSGEIGKERSAQIEKGLASFGIGFSDVEKLLRASDGENMRFPELEELRRAAMRLVDKRNFLVEKNLRLVGSVARRYAGNGCDLEDLIQEGNVGLIKSAERWDYRLGYKFSTYAMWWIRQSITRAIQDSSRTIRIPVHVDDQIRVCKREIRKHVGVREAEIMRMSADSLGMTLEKLHKIISFEYAIVPLGDNGGAVDGDVLYSDADITETLAIENDARRKIKTALSVLDERQREVILMRFGIGEKEDMTLEQVGKKFGVTRERIRQIESKALTRLSKGKEAELLRDLLGVVH